MIAFAVPRSIEAITLDRLDVISAVTSAELPPLGDPRTTTFQVLLIVIILL